MRSIWKIAQREFMETVRTKAFLFSLVATPLLIGAILVLTRQTEKIARGARPPKKIAVTNFATDISDDLEQAFARYNEHRSERQILLQPQAAGEADLDTHTEKMKDALVGSYHVSAKKVSVIPFGINNTVPNSQLTTQEARDRLSLKSDEKIILFFGNIAPYKGLKYTIMALGDLKEKYPNLRLIIAGRIKECKTYWSKIERLIAQYKLNDHILKKVHFIPDEEIEIYFKAADVLVLPYKFIYQSGPLFLSYYYGLPVIASDVGSFREDIKEGETGFICASEDSRDLAEKIDRYFGSDLYHNLQEHRQSIRAYADKKYSWEKIGKKTCGVYKQVLGKMT